MTSSGSKRFYGCIQSNKDSRDLKFINSDLYKSSKFYIPPLLEIENLPPVYDQGKIGSCTSNAILNLYRYELGKKKVNFNPSRLFLYYNARKRLGNQEFDHGTSIIDTLESLNENGVCKNKLCEYIVRNVTMPPVKKAYENALKHRIKNFFEVNVTVNDFKAILLLDHPIAFGFSITKSFDNDNFNGVLEHSESDIDTGMRHAVVCCGYDDTAKRIKIMNSWGPEWCEKGFFYMSYEFLESGKCFDAFILVN